MIRHRPHVTPLFFAAPVLQRMLCRQAPLHCWMTSSIDVRPKVAVKKRKTSLVGRFVMVVASPIWLTAIKDQGRGFEGAEFILRSLDLVHLAPWCPQSRHHLLCPQQVDATVQVVSHQMQMEHHSHL